MLLFQNIVRSKNQLCDKRTPNWFGNGRENVNKQTNKQTFSYLYKQRLVNKILQILLLYTYFVMTSLYTDFVMYAQNTIVCINILNSICNISVTKQSDSQLLLITVLIYLIDDKNDAYGIYCNFLSFVLFFVFVC